VRGFITPEVLFNQFEITQTAQIDNNGFCQALAKGHLALLDVRQPAEYESGSAPQALNIPLRNLDQPENLEAVQQLARQALTLGQELVVLCANGNRSSVAASYLEGMGIKGRNLVGGYNACKEELTGAR